MFFNIVKFNWLNISQKWKNANKNASGLFPWRDCELDGNEE
jgi:hypothetical protein